MEALSRYDVAEYGNVLMVVVESDLLPPDPGVVVAAFSASLGPMAWTSGVRLLSLI